MIITIIHVLDDGGQSLVTSGRLSSDLSKQKETLSMFNWSVSFYLTSTPVVISESDLGWPRVPTYSSLPLSPTF
jgi:hypothetical protein